MSALSSRPANIETIQLTFCHNDKHFRSNRQLLVHGIGIDTDLIPLLKLGIEYTIAGTGNHVWVLNSAVGTQLFQSLKVEQDSNLKQAIRGIGMLSITNSNTSPYMDCIYV